MPYIGDAIPDGIAVFDARVPGLGEHSLVSDFPAGVIANHGPQLVEFFTARVRNTIPSGFTLPYRMRRLVDTFRSGLGGEVVDGLVDAARTKGLLDERGA
jgi:hypothetical protein